MNETGYRNLIHLVSKGYLEGFYYKPRIDLDLLREHSEGLIATSGCLSSMVSRAILGRPARHRLAARRGLRARSSRTATTSRSSATASTCQDRVNAELAKMAVDLRLPLLATNDAHYLEACDHEHHDALLCIGTATNLDDPKRFRFDGQGFYVKDGDEMAELFHDHPSARRATRSRSPSAATLELGIDAARYHMPEFQVPAGTTREEVLDEQAWARAARAARPRAGRADPAAARRVRRAHGARARRDHVDGLRRLLPDRRRLHRLRAAHGIPVGPGPRLRRRAASSPGRSASPASIRSSTTSSSSAS